ncbi:MAG: 4-hydroxyproline epimerase [Cryomorphaceae bacterium]|jgi:4-hydroxyproline epimerase
MQILGKYLVFPTRITLLYSTYSMSKATTFLKIIDSHTGGEPTRVIIDGCPDLGNGTLAEKQEILKTNHDWIRTSTLLEPRGFPAMVGAILTEPHAPDCSAGVIFFNNTGYLSMCIHATIGLTVTLHHMGLIKAGSHRIDTPAGVVTAHLHDNHCKVSVDNVPSYRYRADVSVALCSCSNDGSVGVSPSTTQALNPSKIAKHPSSKNLHCRCGQDAHTPVTVTGDIAWGGNWFFLIGEQENAPSINRANIPHLTEFTTAVMHALKENGITGEDGMPVDHIEVFGPPADDQSDSRNFVLCSGGEYDRSPCGTGTAAKLACLYADGKLTPGEIWRQSSILNTIFTGTIKPPTETPLIESNKITPTITGSAWVNGETTIMINSEDPFSKGIAVVGLNQSTTKQ